MNDFSLVGRRAVVTGAGRGLGREIALAFAEYGADVAAFARTASELDALGSGVVDCGRKFLGVAGDVASRDDVTRLASRVRDEFGAADILVNNAGMSHVEPALDVTPARWAEQFAINLDGAFACAQAFAPAMIAQHFGRIINISSISGIVGMLDHAAYVATKGALNALTKSLAMEWGPSGVTVNAIAPTVILTDLGERIWGPAERGDPMKAKIPIGRFGQPREVAIACVYLASNAAGLCNGHILVLDGGYTAA